MDYVWQRREVWFEQASTNEPTQLREGKAAAWTEMEWQATWYSGALGSSFRSTTGALVEVVQFGFWNREPGPDFTHASIRVDGGPIQEGDIELDLNATNWEIHGHSENSAFTRVILHVFVSLGTTRFFTRTADDRDVCQVHLRKESAPLSAPISEELAKPGVCSGPLAGLTDGQADALIETASRVRLQRKSEILRRAVKVHGDDEASFQSLAVALGYKWNKIPFLVLAQRLGLERLRRARPSHEAILFGVSGLLEQAEKSLADPYIADLWSKWWRLRSELQPCLLNRALWHLGGSRPANHPHRRLGALAILVQRWADFRRLSARIDPLIVWFLDLRHEYWDFHYTLTSKPAPSRIALIGETRINEIFANVLMPLSVLNGQDTWQAYRSIRADLNNRLVKLAAVRLFGTWDRGRTHAVYLFQQQGLLQIFEDFCLADRTGCATCRFPGLVARFAADEEDHRSTSG